MSYVNRKSLLFLSLVLGASACEPAEKSNRAVAEEIAAGLVAACPASAASDESARAQCAAKLTEFGLLSEKMAEPFLWGSQKAGKGYRLSDHDATRFNPFVWRRVYLSLFMFESGWTIEEQGDFIVLHLPYRFRNGMDMGAYPYPLWHSKNKWDSWQLSPKMVMIMEKGKLVGALRSADRDMSRPYVERTWSGQWRWTKDGKEMPYVALYSFLFSPNNPHVERLDKAYRELESEMRSNACFVCHAPDNQARVSQLEFLNYPNMALISRHTLVAHFEKNSMPPKDEALGLPLGIPDETERERLLKLSREFQAAGDDALNFEGELRPRQPLPEPQKPKVP